jgi:hypothetical protein
VSSRELLSTLQKFRKLPKRRNHQQKNQQLQLELKTTRPLQISKLPRLVQFNQLKKLTNSEKLRFNKRRFLAQRQLQRREPLLTLCNSNLMSRRPQLSKLALTQTRKVSLTKPDFKLSAKECPKRQLNFPLRFKLKLKRSMVKKRDVNLKLRRKKLLLNQREQKKQSQLNKNLKRIPTKSMSKMLRNCWILLKKKNLFFNNKKN